ncbi:hypothetical protein [Serratia silvae]|uniref:Uncharacterized protein n=1 Tax=Serratia silvae TaxID=2824122 RepID=A0ABT0KBD3_9GAMM|nr:hypothetical protein [Serratia silvae]MCL1029328.1 hypothetical protein [Serratia silvae]
MAHFAQSPYFVLHQLTCQFANGETLFGPLNLASSQAIDPSFFLVGSGLVLSGNVSPPEGPSWRVFGILKVIL